MAKQIGKQDIVEKIHEANNILIITNGKPEIDHLSACIGLFDLLQALEKKAVLVYSGAVSAALTFLKPDKVIREDAESLRDFIISFGSKVDKFRYSKEGDHYNILLTPAHRAVITEADMKYRKGDFNIDLTIALGVKGKESIDPTISQHDQLMKEIPMVSITAGKGNSSLDVPSWKEESAVALGEMMYELGEVLDEKFKMDKQTANALLLGIVDQSGRFKSRRTRPETMHIAAELLALGADAALVAENLALNSTVPADIPEAVQDETKEMVEDAVGEAGKYDTQLIKDKNKKKAGGRSQRLYIRQGDADEALSYGSTKGDKLKKEEIEEHKLDKLSIDAEGNLRILSEEEEDESQSEKVAPATKDASAGATPAPAVASATNNASPSPSIQPPKPKAPALAASQTPVASASQPQQAAKPVAPSGRNNVLAPSGNIQAPHPAMGPASPSPHPVAAASSLGVSPTALALAQGGQEGVAKAPSINEIVDKSAVAPPANAPAVGQAPPLATANKADSMNQYIDSLSSAANGTVQPPAGAPTVDNYLAQQPPPAVGQAPPLVSPPPAAAAGSNPMAPPAAPPLPTAG